MKRRSNVIAIAWAPHQDHVADDAEKLNARAFFVHYLAYQKPIIAPIKYILQTVKTWIILLRERPAVIYVLNPPFFAPLTVWLYCLFSGAGMIMTSHYSALYDARWKWSLPVTRFLARRALINIVDQPRNKRLFESWGAHAVVFEKNPNRLATPKTKMDSSGRFSVAVINTFADDDPIGVILEAAARRPDIDWHILGDTQRAPRGLISRAAPNVTFTGYLFNDDYWSCLLRANAIMSLTTRERSMMAGAIDGLAIGKPLILSRQPTLQEYFTRGIIFVDNTPDDILQGIREFQKTEDLLVREIKSLRDEKRARWNEALTLLQNLIRQKITV